MGHKLIHRTPIFYTVIRGQKFYFRKRVPLNLVDFFGRKEIKFSLKTGDNREAIKKRAELEVKFGRLLESANLALQQYNLIKKQILADFDKYKFVLADKDYNKLVDLDYLKKLTASIYRNSFVDFALSAKLKAKNLTIKKKEQDLLPLLKEHIRNLTKLRDLSETLRKSFSNLDEEKIVSSGEISVLFEKNSNNPASNQKNTSIYLQDVLEEWKKIKADSLRDSTLSEMNLTIKEFNKVNENPEVSEINILHITKFRNYLSGSEARKGEKLSVATINKRITLISSLLNIAKNNLGANIGFNINKSVYLKKSKNQSYKNYTIEDLNRLFKSEIYIKQVRNEKFWLPLLALYTGRRANELGSLDLADIQTENNIAYLNFTSEGDERKSFKVESSSMGRVPIHREIIDIGFLDYVENLKKQKADKLFPNLIYSKGSFVKKFSSWFGDYQKRLGIADKVFHSFRGTFKTYAMKSDIPDFISDKFSGHAPQTIVDKHYKQASIEDLSKYMQRLNFEGLDLSHLQKDRLPAPAIITPVKRKFKLLKSYKNRHR